MPKLKKKTQQAEPPLNQRTLTAEGVAAELQQLEEESTRLYAEGWQQISAALDLVAAGAARKVLHDRLVELEAAEARLAHEAAEAAAEASDAGKRIAPLLEAAEKMEPSADELARVDAEVAERLALVDELIGARSIARFEQRHQDVEAIGEKIAETGAALEDAEARQRAVHDRAAEAGRLRTEAHGWSDEQARLLEVAAVKRAELDALPRKMAAQAEEADRLRATLQEQARREPQKFIDLSPPQFGVTRDGIHVGPDGWIVGRSGALARLS